jgi:hypothetical protein
VINPENEADLTRSTRAPSALANANSDRLCIPQQFFDRQGRPARCGFNGTATSCEQLPHDRKLFQLPKVFNSRIVSIKENQIEQPKSFYLSYA